jgi:hypothetical protein
MRDAAEALIHRFRSSRGSCRKPRWHCGHSRRMTKKESMGMDRMKIYQAKTGLV